MKILIPLFALLAILPDGRAQSVKYDKVIRLDPSASMGGTVSDLFESIRFIPLETNKESLFSRIGDMQVTEKYFIIYDHNGNNVVIYTKDGKFHAKADLKKAGIKVLDGFSVNREKGEIMVRNYEKGNRLLSFDFDGNFIKEERGDSIGHFFMILNGGYIAFENMHKQNGTPDFDLFIADRAGRKVRSELPFGLGRRGMDGGMPISEPFSYSPQKQEYVYTKVGDYAMHFFTGKGIHTSYKLVLPAEMSLPPDFLTDTSMLGRRYRYVSDNPAKVYKVNRTFALDDCLLFQLDVMGAADRDRILIYNTKNNQCFSMGKVTPDNATFHLPVISRISSVLATDDQYLYISVGAPALNRMHKERQVQVAYDQALTEFFSTDTRMNNPVIIQLKIKQQR